MTASHPPRLLAIGPCLLALFAPLAVAQQAIEEAPVAVAGDLLEARIAATESASDLSDETKSRLLSLYRRALSNLEQAIESEDLLLRRLGELEAAQTDLLSTIARFDELLDMNLLWVRSASRTELAALPEQVWRIASPSGWYGVAAATAYQATHSPVFVLVGIGLIVFLWGRTYLIRFIEETSDKIGKPTTDRFIYSLQVLAVTLAAAAAWPLLTTVVGWQLQTPTESTDFSVAVGPSPAYGCCDASWIACLGSTCRPPASCWSLST